jgi:hypothetical protein
MRSVTAGSFCPVRVASVLESQPLPFGMNI